MKKRILTAICAGAVCLTAGAQLLNVKLGSDALVEEAVRDAIVVAQSEYCLEDKADGQRYGRSDNSYFNRVDFIGCKTEDGVVVGGEVLFPWLSDPDFDKYRNSTKYAPALLDSLTLTTLDGTRIEQIPMSGVTALSGDSLLVAVPTPNPAGLAPGKANPAGLNWIVWVREGKEVEGGGSLELSAMKRTVDFDAYGNASVDMPAGPKCLGGIYVGANVIAPGVVEFSLLGFVMPGASGKAAVYPVSNDFDTEIVIVDEDAEGQEIIEAAPDEDDESELKPLEEKKPSKKPSKKSK